MKIKYLFQYRSFWAGLSIVYLALFLGNHVQVNIDPAYWVMEPTYHLILRNAGLLQGNQFSYYSDSLAPITYNLPYFILAAAVLSFIIVSIIFVVQYIYRAFK
jgi:hypothetical protein